ncbi:MAG TPA: oligoendopeptidase F, partial [Rhodospirillales bacterium]
MSKASATRTPTKDATGGLPRWNLKDLYSGPDARALNADLGWAEKEAKNFRAAYEGQLVRLDGKGLGGAIARYEKLAERLQRIMSYAHLRYVTDLSNPRTGAYFQTMQERVTRISTETVFFSLELNRIPDKRLKRQLKHPKAAHYESWIRDNRVFRPHQLSDELEKLLHEKYVAGRGAWTRLFEETMADLRFTVEGRKGA